MTALAWATLPSATSQSPAAPCQVHRPLQPDQQLLLVTGSSDGCVRLHRQTARALGDARIGGRGAMLSCDLMHLHRTLHDVDLLGVTCVSVKPAACSTQGKSVLWTAAVSALLPQCSCTTAEIDCL